MVSFTTLLQTVYDELKLIVQNNTSVSDPDAHVGLLQRTADQETPFFGFQWTMNPEPRGIGGNVRTAAVNTANGGDTESVERVRDYRLMLDVGVTVDGDEPRTRDEYLGAVQSRFADFIDDSSVLHSDVHRVREDGAIPSNVQASGGDVGVLLTYAVEFKTAETVSVPTMETIDWDVDSEGSDAYPEEY